MSLMESGNRHEKSEELFIKENVIIYALLSGCQVKALIKYQRNAHDAECRCSFYVLYVQCEIIVEMDNSFLMWK